MTEFERLVARVMSNAFIVDTPPITGVKLPKQHRLAKKAETLSKEQLELLVLVLDGKLAMLTINTETYVYRRGEGGWWIRSMRDGEPEHTVFADFSKCSCEDHRFRNRECKHMKALKEVVA